MRRFVACLIAFIAACSAEDIAPPGDGGARDGAVLDARPVGDGGGPDGGGDGSGTRPGDDAGTTGDDAGTTGDDAGTSGDDGGTIGDDGGAGMDASVVCEGAHPIIGPPRTCERGWCRCVETDTCYAAAVVAACCPAGSAIECAAPPMDCMAVHPIIGPPRTCEPGRCYCAITDACFPADRADRCCPVDVVCVPGG